jgi:hypothetical protein
MEPRFPFKSDIVRSSYEYWLSKRAGARLPRRSDIRAEEIPRLLPYLFLVDVVRARIDDPPAFRFRLAGTQIAVWAGRDYTGAMLDEPSYGPNWRQVHDIYANVVATREPAYSEYSAPWQGREFLTYERIIAPLSGDGETIDMLFGALDVLK